MYKKFTFCLILSLGFIAHIQAHNMYWATLFGSINYGPDARQLEEEYTKAWRPCYDAALKAYAQRHHVQLNDLIDRTASLGAQGAVVAKFGEQIEITQGEETLILEFSKEHKEMLANKRREIIDNLHKTWANVVVFPTMEGFLKALEDATGDTYIDTPLLQKHNDTIIGLRVLKAKCAVAGIVVSAAALIAGTVVCVKMIKGKKNKEPKLA